MRKDLHDDSDKALVESEEEVNMPPSRKAKKVSIGDVPAAPAEPDAPRDTPSGKAGDRHRTVGHGSTNCSLFDAEFCHDKPDTTFPRTGSKLPAPQKPEGHNHPERGGYSAA